MGNPKKKKKTEEKAKVVAAVWGDGIDSAPCCTTDLAPGWFEEMDEYKIEHLVEWMLLEKWMIFQFTPHQTTTLPKRIFFQSFPSNHPRCNIASVAFKYVPQTAAMTFAFSSV